MKRHVSGQIQTYPGGITLPSRQSTIALALFLALAAFQEHQVSVCTGKIVLAPGECQRLPASIPALQGTANILGLLPYATGHR